ncbi:hypothetical protein BSKO_04445 [Bryopsis sp. KO-2023]|nr:hypothetical protein BSKO_04445 [Bryopsis sp. KO-2023]
MSFSVGNGAHTSLHGGTRVFQSLRRPANRRPLRRPQASDDTDLGGAVKRFAKEVQSKLPLVGLFSRLTAPEGGVGTSELSYQEFCRTMYDKSTADDDFTIACYELEQDKGQAADGRYILCALWMAKFAIGLLPNKDIVLAATRLRVTQDLEIEIDRIDIGREEALKKYSYMQRPNPGLTTSIPVTVDTLCRLILGEVEDGIVSERDQELLTMLIKSVFPEASTEMCLEAFANRKERLSEYV